MKTIAALLLGLSFVAPAMASDYPDGVNLPIKSGCVFFFPAGFVGPPSPIVIRDAVTKSVLFSLDPGVAVASDTCIQPTGNSMSWLTK